MLIGPPLGVLFFWVWALVRADSMIGRLYATVTAGILSVIAFGIFVVLCRFISWDD